MILRRLAEQLRAQNGIAIEFVLLVAGVFLGIQVANGNDVRKEQALAGLWRQPIIADLALNMRDLQARPCRAAFP